MLPFHFVYANVVYQLDLNGILREVQGSSTEEDIVVMDEEEYFSCVIDCLDTGDQMTRQESAETFTNEVSVVETLEETEKPPGFPLETTTVTRSGRTSRMPYLESFVVYD